jgi:peptide/nickel transport system permease protein
LATVAATQEEYASADKGQLRIVWHGFRKHRLGMAGLITLGVIVLSVILIPLFSPWKYSQQNPDPTLWFAPMGTLDPATGNTYWLGSDRVGRDEFSTLFYGGRMSLAVAIIPAILIVIIGSIIGAFAGFYGRWVDSVLMRITDFLLALPLLPGYLFAIRIIRPNSRFNPLVDDTVGIMLTTMVVFVIFGWMGVSRLVRGAVLSLRSLPYVEAAKALGASNFRIIFKHLLPNALAPVLVAGTFAVGDFIILEAVLSYFGVGIKDPPAISWGNMLSGSQDLVLAMSNLNPFSDIRGYLIMLPSFMLLITVLCINYIGDALRDVLDPRLHV